MAFGPDNAFVLKHYQAKPFPSDGCPLGATVLVGGGRGGRGWWRSLRGRLLNDESVIEMESVYGHCSLNQPS